MTELASAPVLNTPVPVPGDYTAGAIGVCGRADRSNGDIGVLVSENNLNRVVALTLVGSTLTTSVVASTTGTAIMWDCTIDGKTGNFLITGTGGAAEYSKSGGIWSKLGTSSSYVAGCTKISFTAYIANTILGTHSTDIDCNCNIAQGAICPLSMQALDPPPFVTNVQGLYAGSAFIPFTEGAYTKPLATVPNTKFVVALAVSSNTSTPTDWSACGSLAPFSGSPICMAYRGRCPFETKMVNCQAAGASAVIVVNTPGSTTFVMSTPVLNFPGVLISYPDGETIRKFHEFYFGQHKCCY